MRGEELKLAWKLSSNTVAQSLTGGNAGFQCLPDDFNWHSAIDGYSKASQLDTMRRWVIHFRQTFQKPSVG